MSFKNHEITDGGQEKQSTHQTGRLRAEIPATSNAAFHVARGAHNQTASLHHVHIHGLGTERKPDKLKLGSIECDGQVIQLHRNPQSTATDAYSNSIHSRQEEISTYELWGHFKSCK